MKPQKDDSGVISVAMNLEVDVIPVSDVERSKRSWRRQAFRSPWS
jgi:hypothetical protein